MHGYGGTFWGVFFWLAVVAGVVALVSRALRNPARGPLPGCCGSNALDQLGQRYARGEMTREQHEQMKADISGCGRPGARTPRRRSFVFVALSGTDG